MFTQTKITDIKVGDIILDGIASRVDRIILPDTSNGYTLFVTDGNGYSSMLRLSEDAVLSHFDDWTEEDWQAYLDL